jgi:hypothetical protein
MSEKVKHALSGEIVFVLILSALSIIMMLMVTRVSHIAEISLPTLAIGGVIILLTALAIVSLSFKYFELDDRKQALALPEGSIRAVIALMLIIIFAILVVFLFNASSTRARFVDGLDDRQAQEFTARLPKDRFWSSIVPSAQQSGEGAAKKLVIYGEAGSTASEDFLKQILIMLGTLVTSISSFYFGARASSSTPGSKTP